MRENTLFGKLFKTCLCCAPYFSPRAGAEETQIYHTRADLVFLTPPPKEVESTTTRTIDLKVLREDRESPLGRVPAVQPPNSPVSSPDGLDARSDSGSDTDSNKGLGSVAEDSRGFGANSPSGQASLGGGNESQEREGLVNI